MLLVSARCGARGACPRGARRGGGCRAWLLAQHWPCPSRALMCDDTPAPRARAHARSNPCACLVRVPRAAQGYGFCEFASGAVVPNVIKTLHNSMVDTRKITVKRADGDSAPASVADSS
jgi:hypothetical protein